MPRSLLIRLALSLGFIAIACSVVGLSVYNHLQRGALRVEIAGAAQANMDALADFSSQSISKGQQRTFQDILDHFARMEHVKSVGLYSPYGLQTYISKQKSVGMPFLIENNQLKNPNNKEIQNKRYEHRHDWHILDRNETEKFKDSHKLRGVECGNCHIQISEKLKFEKNGRAQIQENGEFKLYQKLIV
ncbi:hypothetical protein KKB55_15745, partial [Myxococcota bacterium]|nr:hypothetical protein [Myxococcota bacterium]